MHLIRTSRRLKVKGMLQVSSPGATAPFPHETATYGLAKSTKATPVSGARKNGKPTKKAQLVKCNGQVEIQTNSQVSQQTRTPRKSFNNLAKSFNGQRSPFQEILFSCDGDLFAGSKSTVTPAPSELPMPPTRWTVNISRTSQSMLSHQDLIFPDLAHDSAILRIQQVIA